MRQFIQRSPVSFTEGPKQVEKGPKFSFCSHMDYINVSLTQIVYMTHLEYSECAHAKVYIIS